MHTAESTHETDTPPGPDFRPAGEVGPLQRRPLKLKTRP
jgi:hypothetical protein